MGIRINDVAPDFVADTTHGPIKFHDWSGDNWVVLFSHPKDFTPICTTELGLMARIENEFALRNTKIIGHSIDSVETHHRWSRDIQETQGVAPKFPIIGDPDLKVAKLYDMLPAEFVLPENYTSADTATVRVVFLIGPDKFIKATSSYPMSLGRNFGEVLRAIDSLQLTARYKVATPVNWVWGGECVIPPAVSDAEAAKLFPSGWATAKPYLRTLPQPGLSN
jgi:alkyl hydroperoxide reductase subunit AhpC